jgi:hypothetical protein
MGNDICHFGIFIHDIFIYLTFLIITGIRFTGRAICFFGQSFRVL